MPFTCPFCGLAPTQPGHICQYCRKPLYPNRKQPPNAYTSQSAFPSKPRPITNQIPQAPPRPIMNQAPPQSIMSQMPPMNQAPPQPMMNQMPPPPMMNQGMPMPPQGMPYYAPQAPLYGMPAPYYQMPQRYNSVGGWLLFFCISLTIITPLFRLLDVLGDIAAVAEFSDVPRTQMLLLLDAGLNLGVLGICLYAGVRLWSMKPDGVKLAKFALLAILIYGIVSLPLIFLVMPSLATEDTAYKMGEAVGSNLIRTFIYVGVWSLYLERSKRVKQTFGFQS